MTNHQSLRSEIFLYLVSDVISDEFNDILCTIEGVILLSFITGNLHQVIYVVIATIFQALSHDYLARFEFSANVHNVKTKLTICQRDDGQCPACRDF